MYQQATKDAIALLKKIIATPSISREEKEVADLIQAHFHLKGIATHRIDNNVWTDTSQIDSSKPTLLLNSHIDTVKPVDGWTLPPFEPTQKNNKIYGLGSNDAGASLVSLIETFFLLSSHTQPYNLIFAATAEEEVSGKNGMEKLCTHLPHIDFAIVGEPTQMQPAIAEKGLMVLDIAIKGQSGHAARNEGKNAIYRAMKVVKWFKKHPFDQLSELLGRVKMSVTQINAGTQHNVIPDICHIVVDIRTNECYDNPTLLQLIKNQLPSYCTCKARSTRLSSSSTPTNHPIIERLLQMDKTPFGSPTLSDQAVMPYASIKIGVGDSARSHTADEYIHINEIEEGIIAYHTLLNGLSI